MFRSGLLLLLAAAAGIHVAHADFMVYTQPPIPTSAVPSFANSEDVIYLSLSLSLSPVARTPR
jgi:hypothetical protein